MSDNTVPDDAARPATVLERAISRARRGDISMETLLWSLMASDVIFINDVPPQGQLFPDQPMLARKDDVPFLALFTHRSFAERYLEGERVVVHVPAFEILRRLPDTSGIAVNLGSALGFELPPQGARAFIHDVVTTPIEG